MDILIYRGNRISDGARALKAALVSAGFNVKLNRKGNVPTLSRTKVINWGTTDTGVSYPDMLNYPCNVDVAVDKLSFFQQMQDMQVSTPEFDEDLGARRTGMWLARTELRGSAGEGIVVIRQGDDVPEADLYTLYVPKRHEYRVHVVNGAVVGVQQKRKREGVEQTADEALIRNAANGWVFCVDNVEFVNAEVETAVKEQCIRAVSACGLHFGAVDVIVGRDDNLPYVLEVNTAPGLESPTILSGYVEAIGRWVNE